MGMVFKRGNVWWIKYHVNGKPIRESSRSKKKMVAKRLLERREGETAQNKTPGIYFDRVTFEDLAEDFLRDYRINGKKTLAKANRSVRHLKRFFEGYNVPQITTPRINKYVEMRLDEGAANATINRELAALKRMLNLGANQTPPTVDRLPHIPMLRENNVRKGFFEHDEFLALRAALPDYMKGLTTFGYKCGWRVSEITNLTWSHVNLEQGIVRLETGETKNDEARTIYLDKELKKIFRQQWEGRKRSSKLSPYVFPNKEGTGCIKDFRGSWFKACEEAGIERKLFHDLRRTAVRNMIRSGVPERVAMMISGHKTREVFDRYNITNDSDLKLAAEKQEKYLDGILGTILGTVGDFGAKKEGSQ